MVPNVACRVTVHDLPTAPALAVRVAGRHTPEWGPSAMPSVVSDPFRLRRAREARGLSREVVALAVGVTYNSVQAYELGAHRSLGPRPGRPESSGLAPATITFTLEPGRSGVTRYAGTNLWTGAGTSNGAPFNVTLSSAEAINVPPVIRVYMNHRQSDQRGVILPRHYLPTTIPRTSAIAVANIGMPTTAGNEACRIVRTKPATTLHHELGLQPRGSLCPSTQ